MTRLITPTYALKHLTVFAKLNDYLSVMARNSVGSYWMDPMLGIYERLPLAISLIRTIPINLHRTSVHGSKYCHIPHFN